MVLINKGIVLIKKSIGLFILLSAASSYATDKKFSDDDIMLFMNGAARGKIDIVDSYLTKGMNINTLSYFSLNTALIQASTFCQTDMVKFLLKRGANKQIRDDRGRDAMSAAQSPMREAGRCPEIIGLLK